VGRLLPLMAGNSVRVVGAQIFDWIEAEVLSVLSNRLRRDMEPDDDFFELGGSSMALIGVVSDLTDKLEVAPELAAVVANPTARGIAAAVREIQHREAHDEDLVFHQGASEHSYILLLPDQWDLLHARAVIAELPTPNVLLVPPLEAAAVGRRWRTLPQWALDVVAIADRHCPTGKLVIGGFCSAALLAAEVARRLAERVQLLVLFEPDLPESRSPEAVRLMSLLRVDGVPAVDPAAADIEREAEALRRHGNDGKQRALDSIRPLVVQHAALALGVRENTQLPESLRQAVAVRREGLARLVMASYDHAVDAGRLPYHGRSRLITLEGRNEFVRAQRQRAVRYWTSTRQLAGDVAAVEISALTPSLPTLTAHHMTLLHPTALAMINDALCGGPDDQASPKS
jgi:acyl carrier protein